MATTLPPTAPSVPANTGAVRVSLAAFRAALDRAVTLVKAKSPLPALASVRITAEPGEGMAPSTLTLFATDLDRSVDLRVAADVLEVTRAGRIALPAATLRAALAGARGDVLTIAQDGGPATLTVGKFRVKLQGPDAEEMPSVFPDEDERPAFTGTAGALQRALARVAFAVSPEESRPIMQGIALQPQGDAIELVATDSRQAARLALALDGATLPHEVIVPANFAAAVRTLFDPSESITLLTGPEGSRVLTVRSAATTYRTRLIEGPFPNLRKIVRAVSPLRLQADRAEMLAAVKRCAFLAETEVQRTTLVFAPAEGQAAALPGTPGAWTCEIAAETGQVGIARDSFPVTLLADERPGDEGGARFSIVLNAGNLMAMLDRLLAGPTVRLELDSSRTNVQLGDPADAAPFGLTAPIVN